MKSLYSSVHNFRRSFAQIGNFFMDSAPRVRRDAEIDTEEVGPVYQSCL